MTMITSGTRTHCVTAISNGCFRSLLFDIGLAPPDAVTQAFKFGRPARLEHPLISARVYRTQIYFAPCTYYISLVFLFVCLIGSTFDHIQLYGVGWTTNGTMWDHILSLSRIFFLEYWLRPLATASEPSGKVLPIQKSSRPTLACCRSSISKAITIGPINHVWW